MSDIEPKSQDTLAPHKKWTFKRVRRITAFVILGLFLIFIIDLVRHPPLKGPTQIRGSVILDVPAWTRHRKGWNDDSMTGRIKFGGTRVTMRYDIGRMAGQRAVDAYWGKYLWQKKEVNRGVVMKYSVLHPNDPFFGDDEFCVTFPELGPANFYTDSFDPDTIEAILNIMRTAEPIPRESTSDYMDRVFGNR